MVGASEVSVDEEMAAGKMECARQEGVQLKTLLNMCCPSFTGFGLWCSAE